MSAAEPVLTVVTAVWNAPYVDLLPRAIASVRAQDPDLPVIVVDNASEVEVPAIPGTTVIRSRRRLSAGGARNLGLERVTTKYVLFLDADDELVPGALGALLEGIGSNPAIAVYSLSLLEAATGARHRFPRRFVAPLAHRPALFAFLTAIWGLFPIEGNAIMRTAWLRDAGGFADRDESEGWVLVVSQAFRGKVVIDPRPGRIYHTTAESLSRRGIGTKSLLAAAREVRSQMRGDPAVPRWARVALPLIAVGQIALIVAVRPVYRGVRALGFALLRR